jgi:glycosyltransferase involved in cell wall biosynthesis
MTRATVALFLPSVHGGGAERAMLNFGEQLLKRGYAVTLIVANMEGALQKLIPTEMKVVNLRSDRMIRALPRLVRWLRATPPDAIFSTITHANLVAACAARFTGLSSRMVVRQSNAPLSERKVTLGRVLSHRLIPYVYRWTRGIIAVSDGVRAELTAMDSALADRIQVLPTPVLTEELAAQGEAIPHHPWFIDRRVPVIVSAGRLVEHKGMLDLIRAFALIRSHREARLIIIGEGSFRQTLEDEVTRLGLRDDVSLPGFQHNPFSYMNHASVFVLASHYEGLPNVLIQAMSFGTPIVATDCRSGPAEILEGGRLGRLVPVMDVPALARAIEESLLLPKQRKAQARAWERFGAGEATSRYLWMAGLPAKQTEEIRRE